MSINLKYISLDFKLVFREAISLHFPEALLRGGFGYNLRKVVCIQKQLDCEECMMQNSCIYAKLFMQKKVENINFHNINSAPPAYLFNVVGKEDDKTIILRVVLLETCFNYVDHIIYTFIRMSETGIGRDRIPFVIENITDNVSNRLIYEDFSKKLKQASIGELNLNKDNLQEDQTKSNLKIKLVSPLRILHKGKLIDDFSFENIIKSALIRLTLISGIYGKYPENFDAKSYLDQAKSVTLEKQKTKYIKKFRRSTRQNQKIAVCGFEGKLEYYGNINNFRQILQFASLMGIGKSTTFGCGRMECYIDSLKIE